MLNLSSEWNLIAIILFLAAFTVSAANPCIDINTASLEELDKIKYVGESRAKQIIILRGEKLFFSVDELDRVIGIGPAIVAKIKQEGLACVLEPQPATTTAPLLEIRSPTTVYPSNIIINEIMPSPEGADETEEWIEIFNKNIFEADLSGWQITDTAGKINIYTFPVETKISAMGFLAITRPETKITLNNDGDGLKLVQPDGKTADSVNYEKAPQGQSYSLINSNWVWSGSPAPVSNEEEKGVAAVSELINLEKNNSNFYPFLAAFGLAILSGFVILFLKYKTRT